ncbi:alpha/beta fold hydrolase [Parendozoicomonas haliclonae]|uniref:alpha/beta fold hydrolase n=1 Tax=Parendozoicomonas haliclonae TaxID=1960125 RepID=UPI0013FD8961|nr:alpha/beta hydrolase [Parendozoicomonas haliclonae]
MTVVSDDGPDGFPVYLWKQKSPVATVHIAHGMAEHALRYSEFAEYLAGRGYQVIVHNHRGHGGRGLQGHFSDDNGWELVIDDLLKVQHSLSGNEPVFLLGHSMGSYLALGFALRYGERLSGLILSGSGFDYRLAGYGGLLLLKLHRLLFGPQAVSRFMNWYVIQGFQRSLGPEAKSGHWLSRDIAEVHAYQQDPHSGHLCTIQLWHDLLTGVLEVSAPENLAHIPEGLPIFALSGTHDPLGAEGKFDRLLELLEQSGHSRVTPKRYPEGRHEMFHELNRHAVFQDVEAWMAEQVRLQADSFN